MKRIAIIGSGPRGMSVLERLAAILSENSENDPLEILLIDNHKVGQGRIWDSDQSQYYLMNTLSTEISAFSGHGPVEQARPGCGPSFAEWWQDNYVDFDEYQGYAPRRYYGQYLDFVLQSVRRHLTDTVTLTEINDAVIDIDMSMFPHRLIFENRAPIDCHAVVLATGHSVNEYEGGLAELQKEAEYSEQLNFVSGDTANLQNFSSIVPGEPVGVIGLGLSFFDTISALTEGRGGQFRLSEGKYQYIPSGYEPVLVCGSRSGVPILARGRNEKPADYKHEPKIFTFSRVENVRAKSKDNIDFQKSIWKFIEAEVNYTYFERLILNEKDPATARLYVREVDSLQVTDSAFLAYLASTHLGRRVSALELTRLARPFDKSEFSSVADWQSELVSLLEKDLQEAEIGNVQSPLKSALDVLRNCRDSIRTAVDFGGLSPKTHQIFLQKFMPVITLLSAGPPLFRLKQLLALIDAGIVKIAPPKVSINVVGDCYVMRSNSVQSFSESVKTLIDARIPIPNLHLDKNPLTRALFKQGVYTSFVNKGVNQEQYDTGGVLVTDSPFHPINKQGVVQSSLFVLGIPTEHTRWFMQSGSSRPSHWIDFMIDADAIARGALKIAHGFIDEHKKEIA